VDLSASEWRRIVLSGTVTNPTVGIKLAVSGDAVAMDYGQIEDGAFATTPILTSTATATRSADVATIEQNIANIYNPSSFTFIVDYGIRRYTGATGISDILSVGDKTSTGFYSLAQYDPRGFFTLIGLQTTGTNAYISGNQRLIGSYAGGRSVVFPPLIQNVNSNDLNSLSPKTAIGIGCRLRSANDNITTGTIARVLFFPKHTSANGVESLGSNLV
jgi:hypothetical protein